VAAECRTGREKQILPAPSLPLPTIAASGEILGIGIGSTLEEARAKLEPHRDPATNEITEKKAQDAGARFGS